MKRLANLDSARGVAAMLVVLDHFVIIVLQPPENSWPHWAAAFVGSFGVGLFFLISGFIIPMSLKLGTRPFIVRRLFRLYPVAIVGAVFAGFIVLTSGGQIDNFLPTISLFGIFILPNDMLLQPVYWTLTIEMSFYLVAAVIGVFVRRSRGDSTTADSSSGADHLIYGALLITLVISGWLLALVGISVSRPWQVGLMVVFTCMPMLIAGWLMHLLIDNAISFVMFSLGVGVAVFAMSRSPYPIYFSPEIGEPSWLLAALVMWIIIKFRFPARLTTWLAMLGLISYPLYVFHVPIAAWTSSLDLNGPGKLLLYLIVCFVIAVLVHIAVEKPFIALSKNSWLSAPRITKRD